MGIAFAAAGVGLTLLYVRETHHHVALEADGFESPTTPESSAGDDSDLGTREIFARASWGDPALASASHAGMVNNLNDGLAWGLFPLFFAAGGPSVGRIGVLSFLYPAVWGVLQLWTGALSDRWGRKWLIAGGMMLQGRRPRGDRPRR